MVTKRRPTYEETFDGVRVRVYSTRQEFEALIGDGNIDDPEAEVWCYPKVGSAATWAHQALLDSNSTHR